MNDEMSMGEEARQETEIADAGQEHVGTDVPIHGAAVPPRFNPRNHFLDISGKWYLPVAWRLVWLRELHPDAHIFTELISHQDQSVLFKATVSIPGGGSATGYGSESLNDFREYIEKGETKAIGRALGALGFGTQFSTDFDEDASVMGGIADAPIDYASTRGRRVDQGGGQRSGGGRPATEKQLQYLSVLLRDYGMSPDQATQAMIERYASSPTSVEASGYIEQLKELIAKGERYEAPAVQPEQSAPDSSSGSQAVEVKPMSDVGKQTWKKKIREAPSEAALNKMVDLIVERHGDIPADIQTAIEARAKALGISGFEDAKPEY